MPSEMLWLLPPSDAAIEQAGRLIAKELNFAPFLGALLARREIGTPDAARDFLWPKLAQLSDPFELPNMGAAVDCILRALEAGERIVLYGDYDVDGVTSLALLAGLLTAYGGPPACFLPMRIEEGYGLSADGIARCVETLHPDLLIAVDCGTASAREIGGLQAAGVDVVVFDHHEAQAELPECVAVVNPKLGSRQHYLCSAGLVFKACHALLKRRPCRGFDLREHLDLAALGTVADLVPLVGENRLFVQRGMRELGRTRRPGIRALMEVAGVRAPVRSTDIGFRLGPRLNAAGRLDSAQAALELLQTPDENRARALAEILDLHNRDRQAVEQRTLLEAQAQLTDLGDDFCQKAAAIVVGAAGWHPGVLGIVASRLMRRHHRPALVIGFDETGLGKGSGRSIEGLSLVGALTSCAQWLDKFGGHEMAAGLTLKQTAFAEFQAGFHAVAAGLLTAAHLQPRLRIDAEASLAELDAAFFESHELLQPCGMGNPQPTFIARQVLPTGEPRVLKEKHLRLMLRQAGGGGMPAIYFGGAGVTLPRPPWDVAFQIEPNEYRGETTLQLQVQAIRSAAD